MRNALALFQELCPLLDVGVLCRCFGIQYMDAGYLGNLNLHSVLHMSRLHTPTKHVTSPPITHDLTDGMISLDDIFYCFHAFAWRAPRTTCAWLTILIYSWNDSNIMSLSLIGGVFPQLKRGSASYVR